MTANFKAAPGRHVEFGGYTLSLLQALADGEQPESGETPAEYIQRHLSLMHERGYIVPRPPVAPRLVVVADMQAACTERMRQLEPNGYPEKAVRA